MKQMEQRDKEVRKVLENNKITTLEKLKAFTGTSSTMTLFRSLNRLGYLASYSHRGGYYTLKETPDFDDMGLWSWADDVMFSRFGTLLKTSSIFVQQSDRGYTASELEVLLRVEVNHTLLELTRRRNINRSKIGSSFVYMSSDTGKRRQQKLMRAEHEFCRKIGLGVDPEILPDELKAGIILFYSLLDEQQRRLFAGLEAAKLGHGGDRIISEILNLNSHTIAKGRRELFSGDVNRNGIRHSGGGRKRVEKKT